MPGIGWKIINITACFLLFTALRAFGFSQDSQAHNFPLARDGKAQVAIVLPANPSVTQQFAASELAKYLRKISGAVFRVTGDNHREGAAIRIESNNQQGKEAYAILIRDRAVVLQGGSGRAILYAVYDFLHRLGCRWLAPQFSFYSGLAEYIPHDPDLTYAASKDIHEQPAFTYRKLDVEEGRSHNTENLKRLIDWMPKLRFNVLMIPLDYGGSGRVQWDKWRKELTPELKKRDLLIEVGGHGYQNFMNAGMEDSAVFRQHPDWFGKDKDCKPSPEEYLVFNTANPDAVKYFTNNILRYLEEHPEIDIFDCWPPDGARWAECPELAALGASQDRQARLANHVDSAIRKVRPGLRLEIIAYARALLPPEKEQLNKDILVDFCPINQTFEKQIYDPSAPNNAGYINAIHAWRGRFRGDISLYSYYRKYGWRSLPNIIPHYMQRDMQWYEQVPLQGISSYAEPGDWGTYELNYYVLGHLAWDTHSNVDALTDTFCHVRYGRQWETAAKAYASLEQFVPAASSIPYTSLKPADELSKAATALNRRIGEVDHARQQAGYGPVAENFSRLLLLLKYAVYDLQIQEARAAGNAAGNIRDKVARLVAFLEKNRNEGVFILSEKNNLKRFMGHYGLD